jgi:hypothetical protein
MVSECSVTLLFLYLSHHAGIYIWSSPKLSLCVFMSLALRSYRNISVKFTCLVCLRYPDLWGKQISHSLSHSNLDGKLPSSWPSALFHYTSSSRSTAEYRPQLRASCCDYIRKPTIFYHPFDYAIILPMDSRARVMVTKLDIYWSVRVLVPPVVRNPGLALQQVL